MLREHFNGLKCLTTRLLAAGAFLWVTGTSAQVVKAADPPHWWAGLATDTLQLLMRGEDLHRMEAVTVSDPALSASVKKLPNRTYALVELYGMRKVAPGKLTLRFGQKKLSYLIKPKPTVEPQGLDPTDRMYLITPDRFANGNPKNDAFPHMEETTANRSEPYARHGGDLAGIIQRLDYLADLGQTALWICPLPENNQPRTSYHGYAITDHYRIDPRFGDLEEYKTLAAECRKRNMKLVMDVVYNHVGSNHYLFRNPPDSTWFHFFPEYQQTNYRAATWFDPYASEYDKKLMRNGWFDRHMPDVNQDNPDCARWLIQNSIWWAAETGTDAFRIDTYAYPDQRFMAQLGKEMRRNFPRFFLFGETWVHGPQVQSWFSDDNPFRQFRTWQQGLTDFQFYFAVKEGLTREPDWAAGIARLYYTLAGDYLYKHPEHLVTFVDNHDEGRYYGMIGKDFRKYRLGLTLLYTLRGIPCLYYGTEVLMESTDGHGKIRQDFPGGWAGDREDYFSASGRTGEVARAHELVRQLNRLRAEHPALSIGKLIQFAPAKGAYAYARLLEDDRFLILVNASSQPVSFDPKQLAEIIRDRTTAVNALSGESVSVAEALKLPPWESLILKLN